MAAEANIASAREPSRNPFRDDSAADDVTSEPTAAPMRQA